MATRTALISGAGIAGATAAYWLARTGWQVTVVEKAGALRSSGNPVDVRGAAADVVREMGCWPALRGTATAVERLVVVDAEGRHRFGVRTRRTEDADQEVEVPRAALADVLLDVAVREAEIVVGDSISGLGQDAAGVDVSFLRSPPRRFDLVLGADGLHSGVRRLAFGPEHLHTSGLGMVVGTMHTTIAAPDPRTVSMFNQPGISLAIHPGAGDPLAAFVFRSTAPLDRHDEGLRTRLVTQAYAGRGWLCDEALAEWAAAADVYFDAVTRIRMPTWSRGRISLLGDAADCVTLLGEGSSNAIVAARTLADALATHPDDHEAALARYERTHRARLRKVLRRAGAASHLLVPATRAGLGLRDVSLRLASRVGGPRS